MGKIRNKKHAYHKAAPKPEEHEMVPSLTPRASAEQSFEEDALSVRTPFPNNVFGSVTITPDMLNQRLVTAVPTRKERRREREALRRKEYASLQVEFKEMLQANKRLKKKDRPSVNSVFKVTSTNIEKKNEQKKRVGVTHMESLLDALPSAKKAKVERVIKIKPRAAKKSKTQAKEMAEDMNTFIAIMKNSTFASDPFSTINTHLKLKLEAERENPQ